ncbi:MAG: peptide MFS transporter [Bacteroidia bacterium]|nr:peptide MFS transporter [Sphingobacteriaceae bacterium]MBK7311653.1 peptide MFS transporter [Sphingobacteriaceae bacterium]MBK7819257.1 peptide MFS transporter [Sphingobacteriaceae bacterium]MBP9069255.1 peptide MFS transporter [Bacteroidia bacterium]
MEQKQVQSGHPKGLYVLFITEMWERFSYYGMRAIFVLFLTKALLYDKAFGSDIYGSYTGLVYLTPLIGGYMADRYWGNRKSIIVGGIMMALGQFLMFLAGSFYQNVDLARIIMMGGLTMLIIGNGFFKPNISTMVGQLYTKGDKRVDSAFTIFYMGINLGAFFAPLVCGYIGDTGDPGDFKWGFLAACFGMILSLILFISLKDKYIVTPEGAAIGGKPNRNIATSDIDTAKEVKTEFTNGQIMTWLGIEVGLFTLFMLLGQGIIGSFIFSLSIAAPGFIISDRSLTKVEKQRIWVIYIVAFFVIFFWAAFEQAGAALTFFAAEQTDRTLFGNEIPASYFQSVNAVAIVIFAGVFVALWGFLGKRNREPASPYKQAIGLFLLALGYVVIAAGVKGIDPSTKVSMMWLLGLYVIHTFGELCLSPIGLSMVNKLAPVKFASLLMGVWFLSTASANKFAGTLSSYYPETMLVVSAVEKQQTEKAIEICPKLDKAEDINGTKYVSIDLINLDGIKDKVVKEDVVKNIFANSVIKEKSFIGYKINDLYSFFMLFVVMAGVASVILFFLSKKLLAMMNGVR